MAAIDRFDFEFGQHTRSELLRQASDSILRAGTHLDGPAGPAATAADQAATRLLAGLDEEIAEFGVFPEMVPIAAQQFELHGLKPPVRFVDLSVDHDFYWLRLPMTLRPLADRPFVKLQCAVEFNPGGEPQLRPVAQMILPDSRFQTLLQAHTSITLGIGEDFEFKASLADAAAPAKAEAGAFDAALKAGVDAKLAANADLTVGPFAYTLKKARIQHTGTGTERVFWTLDGAEFFEEEEPVLVVVLRVPKKARELRVAAALQATHEFRMLAASLGSALAILGERVKSFFKAGAPATHTRVWDLTTRLSPH